MALLSASDSTFENEVINQKGLVLVDFWAEWCGPCRAIAPVLEDLNTSMGDNVKIVKVNIDENPQTPVNYNIRSIPTLILFKDGQAVATQVGLVSKALLEEWIKKYSS
jgi:thioredoxin 1